jgi:S1-C subfamily serine protease
MKNPTKAILLAGAAISLLLLGYFQGYIHGVTGGTDAKLTGLMADVKHADEHLEARLTHLRGTPQYIGRLEIVVKEKPFGMNVRRGSSFVEEVFPGFPAEKLGVRPGCEVLQIAGENVKQGTWMDAFMKTPLPFNMSFDCSPDSGRGHGPISVNKHRYRVMVVKKPFGMNVQVNVVPRVVEVLPGSPAEAAGVKRGFVLTHIHEQAVDSETWFDTWNRVALPCTLTFDTAVPVNDNNLFMNKTDGEWLDHLSALARPDLPDEWEEDGPVPGFEDVRVTVKELPFGMYVDAPPGKLPIVKGVTPNHPANRSGVRAGDVLLKVAGHRVDSSTWFAAFQHAVPPFGLHFRRPHYTNTSANSKVPLPVMPVVGDLLVTVAEKPFGMRVARSSTVIQEVFSGFPAHKLGIRKGCEVQQVSGQDVSQGTWMELFSKTALPFTLKLHCPRKASPSVSKPKENHDADLEKDEHHFQVAVKERPFGMNIQTNVVPRVMEVLPGSPAEAAGIKSGFVLTEIDHLPVDAHSWFDAWTHASKGAILTFDKNMPLHDNNPFVPNATESPAAPPVVDHDASDVKDGYSDHRCAVKKLPFGMLVRAAIGSRPTVIKVVKGSPADVAGIKVGDVLILVAGLPVDTSSWFQAFQRAVPPFGLHFRRPEIKSGESEGNLVFAAGKNFSVYNS